MSRGRGCIDVVTAAVAARALCSSAENETPPAGAKSSSPTTRTPGIAAASGSMIGAKACSTTSTFAPASRRMKSCSGTARRQLIGTSIAPSRAQA